MQGYKSLNIWHRNASLLKNLVPTYCNSLCRSITTTSIILCHIKLPMDVGFSNRNSYVIKIKYLVPGSKPYDQPSHQEQWFPSNTTNFEDSKLFGVFTCCPQSIWMQFAHLTRRNTRCVRISRTCQQTHLKTTISSAICPCVHGTPD